MQTVLSMIWTCVAVSIYHHYNYYTTNAPWLEYIYIYIYIYMSAHFLVSFCYLVCNFLLYIYSLFVLEMTADSSTLRVFCNVWVWLKWLVKNSLCILALTCGRKGRFDRYFFIDRLPHVRAQKDSIFQSYSNQTNTLQKIPQTTRISSHFQNKPYKTTSKILSDLAIPGEHHTTRKHIYIYIYSVSKQIQPVNMIMIYYWDKKINCMS